MSTLKKIKNNFYILYMLFALILIFISKNSVSADNKGMRFSETRILMGTAVDVTVIYNDEKVARKAIGDAFFAMERIDRLMSNFKEDSDISRINKMAESEDVTVNVDVIEVLKKSIHYSELSDGAFDITVGGVEELYRFETGGKIPEKDKLKDAVRSVGYKNIRINENTVRLLKKGTKLDLGGIAAGYAVDKGIEAIKRCGIKDALINDGGDISGIGESENGKWKIGILHPREEDKLICTIELKNLSVATSGDYRKYFVYNGKRYHHILKPDTGTPVEGLRSVTVIAPHAVDADALSTTVFVMGKEKGMALIEKLEDVEGVIVDSNGALIYSSGIKNYILN